MIPQTFSAKVKDELRAIIPNKKCCRRAQQLANLMFEPVRSKQSVGMKPVRYYIPTNELKDSCCSSAFLRGAFLNAGSLIEPSKQYHIEIKTSHNSLGGDLHTLLAERGFKCGIMKRGGSTVIYMKDSEIIGDFLTFIGAVKASMEIINIKIEKEIRNNANRGVNGDAANLDRTINAAMQMIYEINYIEEKVGALPEELQRLAKLRRDNVSMSLTELGGLLDPPLSKSGVSRRLKKIHDIYLRHQ